MVVMAESSNAKPNEPARRFRNLLWRHPGHLFWVAAAYLINLGSFSVPLTGDQKTYVAIANEMRERGSWMVPYLFGEPNYLKPPFQYWATLISWNLFGWNDPFR